MEACIDGTLDQTDLQFEDNAAVCVVLASEGYPVHYEKGYVIKGLENFKDREGYYVFRTHYIEWEYYTDLSGHAYIAAS